MTRRQKLVLDYIEQFWRKWGYSPSYDQIKDNCDIKSTATVYKFIRVLKARGWIEHTPGMGRSIVPIRVAGLLEQQRVLRVMSRLSKRD